VKKGLALLSLCFEVNWYLTGLLKKSGARSGDIEPRKFEGKQLAGHGDSNRILQEC